MQKRDPQQSWIEQFSSTIPHFDALLLLFLVVGGLLIFAAASMGLQSDAEDWLPVKLAAQFTADYSPKNPDSLQLARVDPKIIEAVKQDIELRKKASPTPAVVLPQNTLVPTNNPTITPTPLPPGLAVTAGGPYRGKEGSPVSLKAGRANSLLRLVPGTITYRWDLDGDQNYDDANGSLASVTFYDEGEYVIGLKATDLLRRTAVDTTTVVIRNVPPLVDVGRDRFTEEANKIRFLATARDPGRDILLYEWDFGDGTRRINDTLRPEHTYQDDGTYLVRLRVSDNDGGVTEDFLTVYVENVSPLVEAGPDQTVDEGETITLEGTATDPSDFDTLTYAWDFDYDGNSFQPDHLGPTASTTYPDGPAIIQAALRVEDEDGGQTIDTVNITVNNLPPTIVSVANDGPVGEGSPLTLVIDAVDVAGDLLTYAFDLDNDGSFEITGPAATVANSWDNQGDYTIGIRVDDNDGGQAITTTTVSTFNQPPTAVASADSPLHFEGNSISFSGNGSSDPGLGDVLTYTWNFGDGTAANGPNVTHTYPDNNSYKVSLTVTDDSNAASTDSFTVTILNANPTAKAGLDKQVDEGVNLLLAFDGTATTDPSSNDTLAYAWDFDYDGLTFNPEGTGPLVEHLYPGLDGPYEFKVGLRVRDDDYPYPSDGGGEIGEAIDTLKITVKNLPPQNVNAGGPYRTTQGIPLTLTGSGTDIPGDLPLTFRWDFDYDGSTFTEEALGRVVTHTWPNSGDYTVALRVTDNDGGSSQVTTLASVGGSPTAVALITPAIPQEGSLVTFDGSGSSDPDGDPLIYTWQFGDGTPPAAGITTTHLYADNGLYTTTLQVDDGLGGLDSTQEVVTVNNVAPTAVTGISPNPASEGESITLDGSGSTDPGLNDTLTYEWDLDYDGSSFNADNTGPTITTTYPDGPLTYTIALRVSDNDGGISPLDTVQVTINNAPPIAEAGPDQTVAEGETVTLDGSNSSDPGADALVLFEWDFDYDGSTFDVDATGQTVTTSYPTDAATYTVALRVTDEDGDVGLDTTQITVENVSPTAEAGPDQTVAEGATVTLDGSNSTNPGAGVLVLFEWDFDYDGSTFDVDATGQTVTTSYPNGPATYTVALRVTDEDGDVGLDTAQITVENVSPTAEAGPDQTVTVGEEAVFDGSGSSDPGSDSLAFTWDFADGNIATGQVVTHSWVTTGAYTVTLQVEDGDGGTDTDTTLVQVNGLMPLAWLGTIYFLIKELPLFKRRKRGKNNPLFTRHPTRTKPWYQLIYFSNRLDPSDNRAHGRQQSKRK